MRRRLQAACREGSTINRFGFSRKSCTESMCREKDVLEIACGRGGNVRALCKSYGPRTVAGLDLTEANIAFCLAGNRYEQATFCVGDAEELPLPDECCDIVLNIESSDLYPRITRFFMMRYSGC
ncbi:class I SAM-dependent methyltransferase [Paenibacillus rhizoplanae]